MNAKPEESSGFWVNLLVYVLPLLLFVWFFYMMMGRAGGQGGGNGKVMSFGKSKAKPADSKQNKVRFSDVAGEEEEKQELVEVVEFLKDPRKFTTLGATIPHGVLLEGPPGTGKTLLAKAVAGEAGVPFYSISGSDFVEMFVGVGASRVRDLFDQAKKVPQPSSLSMKLMPSVAVVVPEWVGVMMNVNRLLTSYWLKWMDLAVMKVLLLLLLPTVPMFWILP